MSHIKKVQVIGDSIMQITHLIPSECKGSVELPIELIERFERIKEEWDKVQKEVDAAYDAAYGRIGLKED